MRGFIVLVFGYLKAEQTHGKQLHTEPVINIVLIANTVFSKIVDYIYIFRERQSFVIAVSILINNGQENKQRLAIKATPLLGNKLSRVKTFSSGETAEVELFVFW